MNSWLSFNICIISRGTFGLSLLFKLQFRIFKKVFTRDEFSCDASVILMVYRDWYKPNSKVPPKPGETTPSSQPQKFCYVPEVYKMTKVLEDGRKMEKNSIFHWNFACVNFKIFSEISNLNWFFAQTRKNLPLGFLLSLTIIKSFQNSIKIALIVIKISFFKSTFAKRSWKF